MEHFWFLLKVAVVAGVILGFALRGYDEVVDKLKAKKKAKELD